MALRLSDDDKRAIQAAAAIRAQNAAMDDYNRQMPQAMSNLEQAQGRKTNALESILSGIGNSIANVGKTLVDIPGTTIANWMDLAQGKKQDAEGSNTQEWKKSLYGGENAKDRYAKTAGTALDAAATVSDLIPGLGVPAKVALNVGQGAASGAAQNFIDNGANVSLEDILKGATTGAASAGVGQFVGGKLAGKTAGKSAISKALNSNIGKAALTGAAAGATGGGLNAAFNGGNVLSGALQGAQGGALAGGTMAGTMGLIGSGLDKLNRKYTPDMMADATATPKASTLEDALQTPQKTIVDEVAEQYTKKQPTRRTIDVQYESDNGPVQVNRSRSNQYRLADRSGSTLDGILGPNNKIQLPNAERPSNPYAKMTDIEVLNDIAPSDSGKAYKNLADAIQSGEFIGDDPRGVMAFLEEDLPKDTYNAIKNGVQERVDLDNMFSNEGYGIKKSDLPMLNRDEYYRDTIGRLGNKGNGNIRAEDVPESMYNRLRNDAGKNALGGNMSDNETILRELFGNAADGKDKYELYEMYQNIAETPGPRTYNMDDIVAAVTNSEYNGNLGDRALNELVTPYRQEAQPTLKQIGVKGAPSIQDTIDVNPRAQGQLIQDVIPGKRVAQPQPQVETPTQTPARQVTQNTGPSASDARTKAYDWRGESISGAGKKRNYLQNIGDSLQETAQVTRDASVYGKLKGNFADEMIRKDAVNNLRNNYGYSPDDYKQAAAVSTGVNKWYDNEIKTSGATANIQDLGDRLRGAGSDYILPDKYEKAFAQEIGSALSQANVHDSNSMTMYSADGLEKAAKYLEQKEQKLRRTSHGGDKASQGTLDPNDGKLAERYREARMILRGEINNMIDLDDITRKNLSKVLDDLGATDATKQQILSAKNFAEVKAATSPLEDARGMYRQMKSSGMKRGANADSSTNLGSQIASKSGLGGVLDVGLKPFRDVAAGVENAAGKAIGAVGDVVAGKNIGGKAGKMLGGAINNLNNDTLYNASYAGALPSVGEALTSNLSRQAGLGAASAANNQAQLDQAQQQVMDINNNYNNAMTQAQQMYNQAQQIGGGTDTSTLDRISQGMERALAAGDITAYGQLADLYQQAYKIYGLQNPETTSTEKAKDLSVNQSKAYAGLQQLGELSQMTPDLGTALANSPAGGLVNLFGGNEYANQAKALATTIGYLLSGANIREQEAERIGQAYVPSYTDSDTVRQQKLSRAEQLLRSYLSDTSALQ